MFNKRPPLPRYQSVWNVDLVLQYIRSQPEPDTLSLKDLAQTVVVLMALSNADRASDLHSQDLRFVRFSPEGAKFGIPALNKTRCGPPREAFYPVFREDLKI